MANTGAVIAVMVHWLRQPTKIVAIMAPNGPNKDVMQDVGQLGTSYAKKFPKKEGTTAPNGPNKL